MKFKLDENLPVDAANMLNQHGFEAHTVYDEKVAGCSDDHLIDLCTSEQRILLTLDMDFSDIRKYPPNHYWGIIVIRSYRQSKDAIIKLINKIIPALKPKKLKVSCG